MDTQLLSAAIVFGAAFSFVLLLWKIKGGTASKSDEVMRNALDRVRGINPRRAGLPVPVSKHTNVIKRNA